MASQNSKVSVMKEDADIPKIPTIESQEDEIGTNDKSDQETPGPMHNISTKIKETVNIDLFLPQIHKWISDKIKPGPTLIIGEKIGEFAVNISEKVPSVIARESTSSYVSPKAEVKDESDLGKIDLKPFDLEKLSSIQDIFINIIVIFTLRKIDREHQQLLLAQCKRMLARDGQLIVVGEFYPKSVFLLPIAFTKESIRIFKSKLLKKKINKPITKIDKLANELELKFYDVKYDAGGRIRTYVLTKRWGALVS